MLTVLKCTSGGHFKEYRVEIVETAPNSGLFSVNTKWGKIGAVVNSAVKTQNPVPFGQADAIAKRIISEKQNKGYVITLSAQGQPPAKGQPQAAASSPAPATNPLKNLPFIPQLLNKCSDAEKDLLLISDTFGMQEQIGGLRCLVHASQSIQAFKQTGVMIPVSNELNNEIAIFAQGKENKLDGALADGVFYVFDAVLLDGRDISGELAINRYILLHNKFSTHKSLQRLKIVPLIIRDKSASFTKLTADGTEGVVFKELSAPYQPGRPASGGSQFKFKFVDSATCQVGTQTPNKRSVELFVTDENNNQVSVGKCTIPPNAEIPLPGSFVEVEYLYAFSDGCLFQPVYKGERTDKLSPDTYASLKFKTEPN